MMAEKCDKLAKRAPQNQKQIQTMRPEGRLHLIRGTGLAECAGRAKALELVKNVECHLTRFVSETGVAPSLTYAIGVAWHRRPSV